MENFSLERKGANIVLHISEELDHHAAAQISKTTDVLIEKGNVKNVVFDFSGATVPAFTRPTMPPAPALLPSFPELTVPEKEQFVIVTAPCVFPTIPPTNELLDAVIVPSTHRFWIAAPLTVPKKPTPLVLLSLIFIPLMVCPAPSKVPV